MADSDTPPLKGEHRVVFRQLVDLPSTTYGTFGLYRYPAKFIPHVIAYVIRSYGGTEATVFDPFAGYGTVGAVARIYGNKYEMWDLNPILDTLHKIANLEPRSIDITDLVDKLKEPQSTFRPDWSRFEYWFPEEFIPLLTGVWGAYHKLRKDSYTRLLLTIPLLKVSRYFSYDDAGRMKLSSSPRSRARVRRLLENNWEQKFFDMVEKELSVLIRRLGESASLSKNRPEAIVRAGIDTLTETLDHEHDILVTSPPYLQSQEYIRYAKMDLYWLGHGESEIRRLQKLEIPYRRVEEREVHSKTFRETRRLFSEPNILRVYDTYFHAIVGAFERLQERIRERMCIFVGRSSLRGHPVPIDKILVEHFENLGWEHETTLIDGIVARRMFRYGANPATGTEDSRTSSEYLVVLRRRK